MAPPTSPFFTLYSEAETGGGMGIEGVVRAAGIDGDVIGDVTCDKGGAVSAGGVEIGGVVSVSGGGVTGSTTGGAAGGGVRVVEGLSLLHPRKRSPPNPTTWSAAINTTA